MFQFAFIQVQKAVATDGLLNPTTHSITLYALTVSLSRLHDPSDT
jgi:hypothetical protein